MRTRLPGTLLRLVVIGAILIVSALLEAPEVSAQTVQDDMKRVQENIRNPRQCPGGTFFNILRGTCDAKVRAGCAEGCYRDYQGACVCDCPAGCYFNFASKDCRQRMGSSNRKCRAR